MERIYYGQIYSNDLYSRENEDMRMKEDYKKPTLEIIEFKAEDIITTSGSCACVEVIVKMIV